MEKRNPDVVVISDTHLGTYGCQAKELFRYLKSIKPKVLVLNGDIIDIWQFRKSYFPKSHLKVIRQILNMATKGVKVYYLTGNHDELLRKFTDAEFGKIHLRDKLILDLGGEKAWIFHGDIFDASIQNAKWIAKLGGWGYDLLIMINAVMNWFLVRIGREKYSLSKKIKNSVKKAVKYITDFEETAAELAIDQGYEYVICGHIHQPQFREVINARGKTTYLNSGDWVENLTALEYSEGKWEVVQYQSGLEDVDEESELMEVDLQGLILRVTQGNDIIENVHEDPLRDPGNR